MNDMPQKPIALFDMQAQQSLIRAKLDARIAHVLSSGRFINGPEVVELEERLAAFAGCGHAVGVSSGTDALQIAMMAEGIGRGDAVFLPAFTYTALTTTGQTVWEGTMETSARQNEDVTTAFPVDEALKKLEATRGKAREANDVELAIEEELASLIRRTSAIEIEGDV